MKSLFQITACLIAIMFLAETALSSPGKCGVCGMKIITNTKNHIILKHADNEDSEFHVDAISCASKAIKHDSKYKPYKVVNFNVAGEMIDAEKAFYLVKNKGLKKEIGKFAMPPFYGAFKSKEEAEAKKSKYEDEGSVALGLSEALKIK